MKQEVHRSDYYLAEKVSRRGYRATPMIKLTAKCGHVREEYYRGTIQKTIICKDCRDGKAPVELTTEPGHFTNREQPKLMSHMGIPELMKELEADE
jgi:hypothetical protein